jgi:quinolinate synthase
MTLWPGSCQVHVLFSVKKLYDLKLEHPDAKIIAHPECMDGILDQSEIIGSTNALLEEVKKSPGGKFIVATETGILHQMQKANPTAILIQAPAESSCACNDCPYMKLNTLQKW